VPVPRFCYRCGAAVETRYVDERYRKVCPECAAVHYLNPLPVASALVLNADRHVLLVKRKNDPYKGMWCLPIGFAELNESIVDAAMRELEEETSIHGRVIRLLGAESFNSEVYGDLLVVTFEVEKTFGCEQPGDDAEAVAYFPIGALPELAFAPNESAVRAALEIHREEWAIQDSFHQLDLEHVAGGELLSDALVAAIWERHQEVAELWLEEVRSSPSTENYRAIDPEELRQAALSALNGFARWLAGEEDREEIRVFYREIGARRRSQGLGFHELLSSMMRLRKHIWTVARGQGVWERPIDVYRVLELDRRFVAFWDKAMFQAAKGYSEWIGALGLPPSRQLGVGDS